MVAILSAPSVVGTSSRMLAARVPVFRSRPPARATRLVPCAAGPCYSSPAINARGAVEDLRGRVVAAGVLCIARDFCAAVGLATMVAAHLHATAAWCGPAAHDRLLLAAIDAALAASAWRAGCLHTEVLCRFGALGSGPLPPAAGERGGGDGGAAAGAAAALAALAWGASGMGLTAAVSAQIHALHIQILHKDATIMRLARQLSDGGDGGGGKGI
ncbi:MAG: hypothetical protein J3K34DRAFT_461241 [Monoraphidium minutum]|nr:MAG: hypothetical protein J3K34DRAFT_461241 [Monoraphidium minutum]